MLAASLKMRRPVDIRIACVVAEMEQRIDREPPLANLAPGLGLSVEDLTRLFEAETGASPADYLQALRMRRARILLERTSLSVEQVRMHVGIEDPVRFSSEFRRFHGVAPSDLPRRRWHTEPWLLSASAAVDP
jgi:transcriptional regulator GlxA family with amidase domain